MANRRDLTDRNREQQQPGQPIDFCQGLPFKVRWMGRDPQTGRDLVQLSDGSIVRAGKRIFSGNCPRGTMVDVVDCGANGMIVIDWRDAEIRQPLNIPEIPTDWKVLIDASPRKYENPSQFFAGIQPDPLVSLRAFLTNVKNGQRVLLINYNETFHYIEGTPLLWEFADTIKKMSEPYLVEFDEFYSKISYDLEPFTEEDILAHDQIWIFSEFANFSSNIGGSAVLPYITNPTPEPLVQFLANVNKKIFLIATESSWQNRIPEINKTPYDQSPPLDLSTQILKAKYSSVGIDGRYYQLDGTSANGTKTVILGEDVAIQVDDLTSGIVSFPQYVEVCKIILSTTQFKPLATVTANKFPFDPVIQEEVTFLAVSRE